MNRQDRRKLDKKLNAIKGYKAYKALVEASMSKTAEQNVINNGDRVMLNTAQIMNRPEWNRLNENYRLFVENNKDTVFTAKVRRQSKGGYNVIFDLAEDDTWSFWEGDLIKVEGAV